MLSIRWQVKCPQKIRTAPTNPLFSWQELCIGVWRDSALFVNDKINGFVSVEKKIKIQMWLLQSECCNESLIQISTEEHGVTKNTVANQHCKKYLQIFFWNYAKNSYNFSIAYGYYAILNEYLNLCRNCMINKWIKIKKNSSAGFVSSFQKLRKDSRTVKRKNDPDYYESEVIHNNNNNKILRFQYGGRLCWNYLIFFGKHIFQVVGIVNLNSKLQNLI